MKIYAIRDRLIDYFMQPFAGPDDKNVQAAVARTINQGEVTSDISQAPHHFEIWSLAQVTDDGHIVEDRYLIQDCAALVRRSIRAPGDQGSPGPEAAEISRHRGPEDLGEHPGTNPGPVPGQIPSTPGTPPKAASGPG